jgi:type II secretory pathway predicted ATPase ExeA
MIDLLAWYGLKRYPFDKEIKTSHLLDTEPLRECGARLDFIKRRGGIMLLTGDPGVGKTVGLRRFVDDLNDNLFRPLYTPLTTLKGGDLLRHLNDKLGLPNRAGKGAVYLQIQQEILESRQQRGKTVVIIIDEAHLLQVSPLQELRLLTNFKMDSYDPFILILAGQTDLRRVMDYAIMEPLAQRLAMRYHMTGLSREETEAYIQHHLRLAGASEPIFAPDALAAIHEITYGFPRRVGGAAEQALTYAMFAGKRTVDADTVLKIKSVTA